MQFPSLNIFVGYILTYNQLHSVIEPWATKLHPLRSYTTGFQICYVSPAKNCNWKSCSL